MDGFLGVCLGGACRAAAAVAAGFAADQKNDVPRLRTFTDNIFLRRCRDNRADFHTLGQEARIIDLDYLSGGQADLVPVGAVAMSRFLRNFTLGQLARQGILNRCSRVPCTSKAHGLVNIASARQRISNRAAKTGRRAAEGLDLCGMVVGFVLKHEQPVLVHTVVVNRHIDTAGVDFL